MISKKLVESMLVVTKLMNLEPLIPRAIYLLLEMFHFVNFLIATR